MDETRKRALIVDDNELTRLLVKAALESDGFQTKSARDGAEAIRILASDDQYELIVLDLMMPRVDGYGVVEYLKNEAGFPSTLKKILIITASPGFIDEARLPGEYCDILLKPFTARSLLARVGGLLVAS